MILAGIVQEDKIRRKGAQHQNQSPLAQSLVVSNLSICSLLRVSVLFPLSLHIDLIL